MKSGLLSVLVLTMTSYALCKEADVGKPDLSSPQAAALAFSHAMDVGDGGVAKKAAFGDEHQMRYLGAVAFRVRSYQRLAAAAVAKFGPPGGAFGGPYSHPDYERRVRSASTKVEGDVALVVEKPDIVFLRLKRFSDGDWRVEIARSAIADTPMQVEDLEGISRVVDAIASETETGLYSFPVELQGSMEERLPPSETRKLGRPDDRGAKQPETKGT